MDSSVSEETSKETLKMELKGVLIGFFILFISQVIAQVVEKKVVCQWASKIGINQVNPMVCTHIAYNSLEVDASGAINLSFDTVRQDLKYLVKLREQNPSLKVLATIGDSSDRLANEWSSVAGNANTRNNFAKNVLSFVQNYNLDGIDIDWEYPNHDGNSPEDVQNFVLLLKALKEELGEIYSLSVDLGIGVARTQLSYDIPAIFEICDFVNLKTYDLRGGGDTITGIHNVLYQAPNDVNSAIKVLADRGVNKRKIIMGIPMYGYAYTLVDPSENSIGSPAIPVGPINYNEICQKVKNDGFVAENNVDMRTAFAYKGTEWIGYDNVKSIKYKTDYISNLLLGGAMIRTLDLDDYDNKCEGGFFPLVSAVYKNLIGSIQPPATTNPPSIATTEAPTNPQTPASTNPPSIATTEPPTAAPTNPPTPAPTNPPSIETTEAPTAAPTNPPTVCLTNPPSIATTKAPTAAPTNPPKTNPTTTTSKPNADVFVCPGDGLFKHLTDCTKFYNCAWGTPFEFQCQPNLRYNEIAKACDWANNVPC